MIVEYDDDYSKSLTPMDGPLCSTTASAWSTSTHKYAANPEPPSWHSPYNWISVQITSIGSSNLEGADTFSYPIPDLIPSTATEVLVYVAVYSGSSATGPYHSLKLYTQIRTNRYEKYLYVMSADQPAYSFNSDNMWFPMPPSRLVYLTVPAAHNNNVGFCLVCHRISLNLKLQ